MSSQNKTPGEPKILYYFSVIPASPQDLENLKRDLIQNEVLRFHFYVSIPLQSIIDYEQGKRPDVAKLIIREVPSCSE